MTWAYTETFGIIERNIPAALPFSLSSVELALASANKCPRLEVFGILTSCAHAQLLYKKNLKSISFLIPTIRLVSKANEGFWNEVFCAVNHGITKAGNAFKEHCFLWLQCLSYCMRAIGTQWIVKNQNWMKQGDQFFSYYEVTLHTQVFGFMSIGFMSAKFRHFSKIRKPI